MSSLIGIDIHGQKRLDKILCEAEHGADAVADDVNKYLLNVLRMYPPQKRVSRRQAYGKTWFSDRQRRWFWANFREGNLSIPYKRTQALSRGWKKVGSGATAILANEVDYGGLVMGPGEQSRHPAAIGWKTTDEILEERMDRVEQIARGRMDRILAGRR